MTRQEAEQILIHYDDLVWQQDNHITCGMISEALNLATDALSEPTQEQFIDKACRWLVEHSYNSDTQDGITCTSVMTEGTLIEDFRKAMAVKESLITAEKQVWHKVSEELPPVDTTVVCKMKGVPHTEHFVCKWDGEYWWTWNYCGEAEQGWFGLNTGWEVVEWKEI